MASPSKQTKTKRRNKVVKRVKKRHRAERAKARRRAREGVVRL